MIDYVPTAEQYADIFTKPLGGPAHHHLCDQLGLGDMPGAGRGTVPVAIGAPESGGHKKEPIRSALSEAEKRRLKRQNNPSPAMLRKKEKE
jgi:hypothetical protein